MRRELEAACARYRLAPPRRVVSGVGGERLGSAAGSSLEFMDFRDYAPGDDLRHVDWRSYARTDQLRVRLYREEVSPALDVVADLSASMGSTAAKERATRDLVEAFARWGERAGGRVRRLRGGGGAFDDAERAKLGDGADREIAPRDGLRPNAARVVVSDFLVEDDPAPVVRRLAARAAHLDVIQLLDPWELDPTDEGPVTLVDVETGARLDLDLGARARRAYTVRLARLRASVERAARSVGARYACVRAGPPEAMFRGGLLPGGVVEPSP